MAKKFGFVTCVQLGLSCMEAIYEAGGHLDLVMSLEDDQAPKKSGRIYVDDFCQTRGIDVVKVRNINSPEAREAIRERGIEWLFIIGWSQIAKPEILDAPKNGVLGMHPTLLPTGRGRAAIPWAILKGLEETGVTLFQLDPGVDTGPILFQERIPVAADETASSLYARVNEAHRTLIHNVWPLLVSDGVQPTPQDDSKASYWEGRKPEDGRITGAMRVDEVERLVRAVTHPYPGAFLERETDVLRVWAGRPAQHDVAPEGAARITLADGAYDAVDFAIEPKPNA